MDTSDITFLSLDGDTAPAVDVLRLLNGAQGLALHRTPACDVTCEQGTFSYSSVRHASRSGLVLFLARGTGQFGIGLASERDPYTVRDATQYPTFDTALKVFLRADAFPGDAAPETRNEIVIEVRG
jgi:hypothetical protein